MRSLYKVVQNLSAGSVASKFWQFVFIIISVGFIISQYKYSLDSPYAPDDARMYLSQFQLKYVDAGTFFEKISYFFSVTNYPHTKLTGRIISTLHYEATNSVNFKFLIMSGSVTLVGFVLVAKSIFSLDYFLILPLALLLLLPENINFWIGPISGYPFLLIYGILVFNWLSKGRIAPAAIVALIASFTHSPGIAIFIAAAPLFLVKPNNRPWKALVWVSVFIFTALLYWKMVLIQGDVVRSEGGKNLLTIAKCIPSLAVYEGQFLALPFFGSGEASKTIRSMHVIGPILGSTLSISVLIAITLSLFRNRKTYNSKAAGALAFLLLCLIPGPISAFISDDCSTFGDLVAPRYIMYSVMAWTGIYLFAMSSMSRRSQIIIALVFAALCLPRFIQTNKKAKFMADYRQYIWLKRATFNSPSIRREEASEVYISAMNSGIYSPYFPDYQIATGSFKPDPNPLTDFWYNVKTNSHFCKIEAIIKNRENEPVEIWVDEEALTIRHIPVDIRGNWTRRSFQEIVDNPKIAPAGLNARGYFFSAAAKNGCQSMFRIRKGNRVSDYLVPVTVD